MSIRLIAIFWKMKIVIYEQIKSYDETVMLIDKMF